MMTTDIMTMPQPDAAAIMERVMVAGDLEALTPQERSTYYLRLCESLRLNPLTRPFEYLKLDGKLVLYARRDATDQLRAAQNISIRITNRTRADGLYIVEAVATTPDGRTDTASGVVVLEKEGGEWKTSQNGRRYFAGSGEWEPLRGTDLANALMKAETKAKRRVTLSICGLGWMDESELDTARGLAVRVNLDTGEILDQPQRALPAPTDDTTAAMERLKVLRQQARDLGAEVPKLTKSMCETLDQIEMQIGNTEHLISQHQPIDTAYASVEDAAV